MRGDQGTEHYYTGQEIVYQFQNENEQFYQQNSDWYMVSSDAANKARPERFIVIIAMSDWTSQLQIIIILLSCVNGKWQLYWQHDNANWESFQNRTASMAWHNQSIDLECALYRQKLFGRDNAYEPIVSLVVDGQIRV